VRLRKREIVAGARPRKSTAALTLAWIGVFVLYLFVKPDEQTQPAVLPLSGLLPAAVTQSEPAPAAPEK